MAPAIVNSVKIEDKKAIVSLNSEQKSKAIGKNGINIRLASMLSGYEIELNELSSSQLNNAISNEEAMKNLQDLFKFKIFVNFSQIFFIKPLPIKCRKDKNHTQ